MLMSHMSTAQKIAEMYVNAGPKRGPYAGYEGYVPAQPALCIPALVEQDGPLGVHGAADATQLPDEVSLGSSWDPSLARLYGAVNGLEHREDGIAFVLGPGINIQRDPRWGRNFEMFSEDPLLTASLGAADIEGLQSQHVMAEPKHFVAYNEDTGRIIPGYNSIVSTRVLHEIYLPPFYSAVKQAHTASIMCSYAAANGQYSCQDASLLTGIIDARWAFPGFIRSDGAANRSTIASANAGLDQERGSFYWDNGRLATAAAEGQVRYATINDAVRRILTEMFKFGLFNAPPTGTLSTAADSAADDAFALDAAERGTVLLRNTGHILPLSTATTKSIAVIGSDGTTHPVTTGGGSAFVKAPHVVSPLAGIAARAGSGVTVTSYSGTDPAAAAATASHAQVAVVFAGASESEGADLQNISLPNNQDAMIESVVAANPNTIVVLNTGGPVLMPWLGQVKAVLEAWYPGQEDGNAIASVLFGDTNPSGHLPETFPVDLSQIPTASPSQFPGVNREVHYSEGLDVGYRYYNAHNVKPLFPFGFGLSYTSFRFSHLTVKPKSVINAASGPDASAGQGARLARVTARVTNSGAVSGSDVVQLYVSDPASAGEPPRQLEGFQRVTLAPGQSKTVTFRVTGHELSYFATSANGWTLPRGRFSVYVGDSSALTSLPLHGSLTVRKTVGARYAKLLAPGTVNPGSAFIATAHFVNHGNLPIRAGTVKLTAPRAWTIIPGTPKAKLSLAPGQSVIRTFLVAVPDQAQGSAGELTTKLSAKGGGAGNLSASTTVNVRRGITMTPLATTVTGPGKSTVIAPGQSVPVTLTVTSHLARAATLHLAPSPPSGVTFAPVAPTVRVRAHHTAELTLSATVAAGTPPGTYTISLNPSFVERGKSYRLLAAALPVSVPFASLAASYNTVAISDDTNVNAADFDGSGDSYSEQALLGAGLAPGATVTVGPVAMQWPDVPAGSPDSVLSNGQTIALAGSPTDTQLTMLGASAGSAASGTGAIHYTDGTVQNYRMTLNNWLGSPGGSNTAVATTTLVNHSAANGNGGVNGQRKQTAYVYAVSIPLEAGKTVSSVTLPTVPSPPSMFPMHVFALGIG